MALEMCECRRVQPEGCRDHRGNGRPTVADAAVAVSWSTVWETYSSNPTVFAPLLTFAGSLLTVIVASIAALAALGQLKTARLRHEAQTEADRDFGAASLRASSRPSNSLAVTKWRSVSAASTRSSASPRKARPTTGQ